MKIITLDKETMVKNLESLIKIDRSVLNDFWDNDKFLLDLPCKWKYSLAVIDDEAIVGYLISSCRDINWLHVHSVAILPECQRKGFGKALLRNLFNKCHNTKIYKITLKAYYEDISAQKFYEALGFVKINIEDNEYIIYQKMIT